MCICEKLPPTERAEVTEFARGLLAKIDATERVRAYEEWIKTARGAGKPGITTDEIMNLTRGES